MKVKCLHCEHEFELKNCYHDELGDFTVCPECEGSFDIDIDYERFKVWKNGKVVSKYTEKQLARLVKGYAKEDGCTHYILMDEDGAIYQTCDPWINWQDINEYAKAENDILLRIIEPK